MPSLGNGEGSPFFRHSFILQQHISCHSLTVAHTSPTNFNGPHSMKIYGDLMFSKRGAGLWVCMCGIIELNSDMKERARKSKLLPEGLFRLKAAVYRRQAICYEPYHTHTSSDVLGEIFFTHLPTDVPLKNKCANKSVVQQHNQASIVRSTVKTCKTLHNCVKTY